MRSKEFIVDTDGNTSAPQNTFVLSSILLLLPILSNCYMRPMVSMSCLHLARFCASSPDTSLFDTSFLMLSNHLRFGLRVLLFPRHLHHMCPLRIQFSILCQYRSQIFNVATFFKLSTCKLILELPSKFPSPLNLGHTVFFLHIFSPHVPYPFSTLLASFQTSLFCRYTMHAVSTVNNMHHGTHFF